MKQARIEISIGARVRKRGGAMDEGTVVAVSPRYRGWVDIAWDAGQVPRARPLVCHVNELELSVPNAFTALVKTKKAAHL